MKTQLIALSVALTSFFTSFAQENEVVEKKVVHRIGWHAGTTSGAGLSYKAVFNNDYELQLTALPVASRNNKYMISGLNFFDKFVDTRRFDILYGMSFSHEYQTSNNSYYGGYTNYDENGNPINVPSPLNNTRTESNTFNTALNIGFEVGGGDIFKFNFQLGYGVYNLFSPEWVTLPSIGVGMDFRLSKRG